MTATTGLRLTWIGHSTVLVELDGVRLLTDPVLRDRFVHLRRVSRAAAAGFGDLDAVLLSHLHYDHLDLPSLRLLGSSVRLLVPRGGGRMLSRKGFTNVEELDRGEEVRVGPVSITATHAEHSGRRSPLGANAPPLGYVLAGSSRVYFAGDTDLFDEMTDLGPGLDVALLPVAGWGLRVPAGHLDPERAAEALRLLRPRVAVPIHWGTYRITGLRRSHDRLHEPPEKFAELAGQVAPDVEVRIVPVGQTLELQGAPR